MVAERDHLAGLAGFGHVGVGVDQVVGAAVLGEEGQHGAGALGAGGHVVFLQRGVVAPVHDGVEVQVEDRVVGGGQPGVDHFGVEGGQEPALVVVAGAVGVVGERGFLRQHRQPGEQGRGRVGDQQVIDVGDAAGAGQLQRQQRQQPGGRGHHPGARVAGRRTRSGSPSATRSGISSSSPALPVSVVAGQVSKSIRAVRGSRVSRPAVAGLVLAIGLGVAQQPPEAFLGEDLAHAGAIQRGVLGGQPRGDLVGGQPFSAQLDHPPAHAFLGRRRPGHPARFAGRGEQRQLARCGSRAPG